MKTINGIRRVIYNIKLPTFFIENCYLPNLFDLLYFYFGFKAINHTYINVIFIFLKNGILKFNTKIILTKSPKYIRLLNIIKVIP